LPGGTQEQDGLPRQGSHTPHPLIASAKPANVIAYNTKLVPAAEARTGWKDLLDPKTAVVAHRAKARDL